MEETISDLIYNMKRKAGTPITSKIPNAFTNKRN